MPTKNERIGFNFMIMLIIALLIAMEYRIVSFLMYKFTIINLIIWIIPAILILFFIYEFSWLLKLILFRPKYEYFRTEHYGRHEHILLDYFNEIGEPINKEYKDQIDKMGRS